MRNLKRRTFFCVLICLVFMAAMALAMSQSEWDSQCINKTTGSTTVYGSTARDSVVATLSGGSYVKQSGFDPESNLWHISFYQNGSVSSGYVESGSLTVAMATVSVDGGSMENIPESMAGNYEAIAEYLNSQYSDRVFSAGGSGVHVEYLNKDADDGEVKRQVTIKQSEIIPVPENLQNIVQLGSKWTIVRDGEENKVVETASISFSEKVKAKDQLAVIYASRKGEVTMHTQPRVNSSVLCKIPTGTVVAVLKKGNNYTRIFYDGMVGCVLSTTIRTLDMTKEPVGTGILTYDGRVIRGQDINVRSGPSGQARILESWVTGTEVQVWSHQKSFYEIEYQGIRVYVNDRFLTVTENAEPSWVTGDGEALDAAVAALSQPRSGTVKSGNSGDTGDEEESGEEMESSAGLTHPASYGADDLGITPDAPIAPQNYPGGTP